MNDFAESFYAKMSTPEPAKSSLLAVAAAEAAEMAQDRGKATPVLRGGQNVSFALLPHLAGPAT
jgi:hypothetical protein